MECEVWRCGCLCEEAKLLAIIGPHGPLYPSLTPCCRASSSQLVGGSLVPF